MTLDELRAVNRYAESTKSLSYLPQVHERQTARMRTRSEWFLTPVGERLSGTDSDPTAMHVLRGSNRSSSGNIDSRVHFERSRGEQRVSTITSMSRLQKSEQVKLANEKNSMGRAAGLSASVDCVKLPSLRRTALRDKGRLHRSSSRRNKEIGLKCRTGNAGKSRSLETVKMKRVSLEQPAEKILKNGEEVFNEEGSKECTADPQSGVPVGPQDCTEMDVQTFHITLTYKPRI